MTDERRRELAADWRRRADRLDDYARELQRDGYSHEAEDASYAAADYRLAADELELEVVG